jgi:hypothetical protein
MRFIKPEYYNTLKPYKIIPHTMIDYTTCREFNHISRYRGLRQIIHNPDGEDRFIALENTNPFSTSLAFQYYEVPLSEENRLDLIAKKFYGSPQYSWIISYYNQIEDGYSVREGQKLLILKNFTDLFANGELLAPIPAMQLNLGSE